MPHPAGGGRPRRLDSSVPSRAPYVGSGSRGKAKGLGGRLGRRRRPWLQLIYALFRRSLNSRAVEANSSRRHRVVIVGGGAAGLELATSLGRNRRLNVTLVDRSRTHVWKPKLHEIAAGSMDTSRHEVGYLAHARNHGFLFRIGRMSGLDRTTRLVTVDPYVDVEGEEVTPRRSVHYDTLIIAVGSQSNDFGTSGVKKQAFKLESHEDATRFNRKLINACFRVQAQNGPLTEAQLRICIIGGGATGVELAAELHRTGRELLGAAGGEESGCTKLEIHLVEAADRILPALPPRLSNAAHARLVRSGIQVHVCAKVESVGENEVALEGGQSIAAEISVWAAGVKAPAVPKTLGGLEVNRLNQLVVRPTLQTTLDPNIFAIGDCAACTRPEGGLRAPASTGCASAGIVSGAQSSQLHRRRRASALQVQGLRCFDFSGRIQHRGEPDGKRRREKHVHRGIVRKGDVSLYVQDA